MRVNSIVLYVLCIAVANVLLPSLADAGITLSKGSKNTRSGRLILQAEEKVKQQAFAEAQTILVELENEQNQLHPDLVLADLMLKHGFSSEARSLLERFSATSGPRFDLFLVFANLALSEKRWFDAFVQAEQATRMEMPNSWTSEYKHEMKEKLDVVRVKSIVARGNWVHAQSIFESYQLTENSNPELLALAAQAAFHTDDARKAFDLFSMLSVSRPESVQPYVEVAKLYEQGGNHERAEAFFRRAIEVENRNKRSLLEYSRWLVWQNRPNDAREQLVKLENAVEFTQEREYLQALAFRLEGQNESALKLAKTLHETKPYAFPVSNLLAQLLVQSPEESDREEALEIARANVASSEQSAEAWATLGWIYLQLDDLERAEESFAIATKSGAISRDTTFFISRLRDLKGDKDTARELLQQALESEGPFFFVKEAEAAAK